MKKFTLRSCQALSLLPIFIYLINLPNFITPSHAETVQSRRSNENRITDEQIRTVFLDAAINPFILHPDQKRPNYLGMNAYPTHINEEKYRKFYPWMAPFMFHDTGVPKFAVINKWNKDIQISFGFPNNLKPSSKYQKEATQHDLLGPSLAYDFSGPVENQEIVLSQVQQITPILSDLTGLKITYTQHETEDALSNMRIIMMPTKNELYKLSDHHFGIGSNYESSGPYFFFDGIVWTYMPGSVFFTPALNNQVYGYIFPDGKNNIQMSFCYIWQGHDEFKLRALVNECLIRSLGLTNVISTQEASFLGEWNNERRLQSGSTDSFPADTSQLPELDKKLIKMLYLPNIHSGDDILKAYRAITR